MSPDKIKLSVVSVFALFLIGQSDILPCAIRNYLPADSNVVIKKNIVKQDSTEVEEDDLDNDMYVPYGKWQNDKFDNWGKHKRKVIIQNRKDSTPADTTGGMKKEGFGDQEKETFILPGKIRMMPEGYFLYALYRRKEGV